MSEENNTHEGLCFPGIDLSDLKVDRSSSGRSVSCKFNPPGFTRMNLQASIQNFQQTFAIGTRRQNLIQTSLMEEAGDFELLVFPGCGESIKFQKEDVESFCHAPSHVHIVSTPNSDMESSSEGDECYSGSSTRKRRKLNEDSDSNTKKIDTPKPNLKIFPINQKQGEVNKNNENYSHEGEEDLGVEREEIYDDNRSDPDDNREKKPSNFTKESLHRNVYKNFGNAIQKMIEMHSLFIQRTIDYFMNDKSKHDQFIDWLKRSVKLVNKQDYERGWTIYKNEDSTTKEFKELLKIHSADFLENYAIQYLVNSKKMTDFDIHIKSVGTFLRCLQDTRCFQRFSPII